MSQIGHFREPKGSARAHTLGTVSKNFAVRAPCACNHDRHETSIDGRISVPRRRQGLETGVLRWQEPREHFSIPGARTERASPTENASQGTETSRRLDGNGRAYGTATGGLGVETVLFSRQKGHFRLLGIVSKIYG